MLRSAVNPLLAKVRSGRNRCLNLLDTPVVILIYHRVASLASDPQLLAVSPENFRAQLRFLKRNYPILRFDEPWGKVERPSVAITFDDGYADNALQALPILEEEQVHATFFVSTGTIGTVTEFWWDELERIVLEGKDLPALYEYRLGEALLRWETATPPQRLKFYRELHPIMRKVPTGGRNRWLDHLREWAGLDGQGRLSHRPVNREELRRLGNSPFATVGAHTVSHTLLSALSAGEQREEIVQSKKGLEELLGKEVTVFSYPFGGKKDFTADSVAICREAGFTKVAANFPGQARRWTDPYRLPRQLVRNWGEREFAHNMAGFFTS